MLALSRRIGESLRIGDDLVLEVLDVAKHTVMLELECSDPDYDRLQWLVVERRIGETFQITPSVSVSVADVNGCQARLAINAPTTILILRSELCDVDAA